MSTAKYIPKYTPPEDGLCLCGCGQITPIAKQNHSTGSRIKGKHVAFCYGHKAKSSETYQVDPETGCWVFQRHRKDGYARITRDGKRVYAHRWYYEQAKGPIPAEMDLDHLCSNPACCNPDHLEPVPTVMNIQRGRSAVLTVEQVQEIRMSKGKVTQRELAQRYNVSKSTINFIRMGRTWKNVESPKTEGDGSSETAYELEKMHRRKRRSVHAEDYLVDMDTGCWIWQHHLLHGYGVITSNRRRTQAHRYYYEQTKGSIPEGMILDHLCRNRSCVNPDHMEPVTPATNNQRGQATKLTIDQVREIRSLKGKMTYLQLAGRYSVSTSTIRFILTGRTWKNII